jgi:hypothetical protein
MSIISDQPEYWLIHTIIYIIVMEIELIFLAFIMIRQKNSIFWYVTENTLAFTSDESIHLQLVLCNHI